MTVDGSELTRIAVEEWPGGDRSLSVTTANPGETAALGRRLGGALEAGDVVLLSGDLGAGKTALAQGIAAGLGIVGPVPSPTFTLVNEYEGRLRLYHLDLYRLADSGEAAGFGYEEYLDPVDGVSVIEWPARAGGLMPERYLAVEIELGPGDRRRFHLRPVGDRDTARRWLGSLAGGSLA